MDLLDARGYELTLSLEGPGEGTILYLGPEIPDHPEEEYDEDRYVKSHIQDQAFKGAFKTALKDSGIRKTGLRLRARIPEGSVLKLNICDDMFFDISSPDGHVDEIYNVADILTKEKEYLSRIRGILYSTLAEVDRICTRNGIPYYLVFGGLLGALRYDEMIPWDDDADIAMTRADYMRFREAAAREMSPDWTVVDFSEIGEDVFLDFMCRVVYKKERIPCNIFRKAGAKCRKDVSEGISMDIFILDNASDKKWQHKMQMFMVRTVYGMAMGHRAYIDPGEYKIRDKKTQIAVKVLPKIGKLCKTETLFKMHDRICTRYNKKDTRDYFMSNGFLPFIHTRYEKKWFAPGKRVTFGPLNVMAPVETEAYLKRAYYDYYHFVPMEKRKSQHSAEADGVF